MLEDRDIGDHKRFERLFRKLFASGRLESRDPLGSSTQPEAADGGENELDAVPNVLGQPDHTVEPTSKSPASGTTSEVPKSPSTPDLVSHVQSSSHSSSVEGPELPPALESDAQNAAPAAAPQDSASPLLPGQMSKDYGPAPYFSQETNQTLDWIGNEQWLEMKTHEVEELAKTHPLQLLYAYAHNPTRGEQQCPFIYGRAKHVKNEVKEGRKTGNGTRGSNTTIYKTTVWEAGEKEAHMKRKQEARATPVAESEAGSSTPGTTTQASRKKAGKKIYAPATEKKKAALELAIGKGDQVLEGLEDSPLKVFLKRARDEANAKLQKSIREKKNRQARDSAKESANAAGDTVAEVQTAAGTRSQEAAIEGITGAKQAAVNTKKRKGVAATGAELTSASRKKIKGTPSQKENLAKLPAPTDRPAGLEADPEALPLTDPVPHALTNISFGHMLPQGNIPNMPATQSGQHSWDAPPLETADLGASHMNPSQLMTEGDASGNCWHPIPQHAQPVARLGRRSQHVSSYPTPPLQTPSMLIPSGGTHYPFSFSAPRPSSSGDYFTHGPTGYVTSPYPGNLPRSSSHTPVLSPMTMGSANYHSYSAELTVPNADAAQQLTRSEVSSGYSHPTPYYAQPIAGPSRRAHQVTAYPTPPLQTPSPLIPSGGIHYRFGPTAPRASSRNYFTSDRTGRAASPHLMNFPSSSTHTPVPSPMGFTNGSLFNASSGFSEGSPTHHDTPNIASPSWLQLSGSDIQQSASAHNVQLPSTPLESDPFDYNILDIPGF